MWAGHVTGLANKSPRCALRTAGKPLRGHCGRTVLLALSTRRRRDCREIIQWLPADGNSHFHPCVASSILSGSVHSPITPPSCLAKDFTNREYGDQQGAARSRCRNAESPKSRPPYNNARGGPAGLPKTERASGPAARSKSVQLFPNPIGAWIIATIAGATQRTFTYSE